MIIGFKPVDKATRCGGGVGLCRVAGLTPTFEIVDFLRRFRARRGATLSIRTFIDFVI